MGMSFEVEHYKHRIEEGDFCAIYIQERWDGFGNNLDFFNSMKGKGWELIATDIQVFPKKKLFGCIAEQTVAEFLFKKIKKV